MRSEKKVLLTTRTMTLKADSKQTLHYLVELKSIQKNIMFVYDRKHIRLHSSELFCMTNQKSYEIKNFFYICTRVAFTYDKVAPKEICLSHV